MTSEWAAHLTTSDLVLDSLPKPIEDVVHARDEWAARRLRAAANDGREFVANDVNRWKIGQFVRVAFNGGDAKLHADIANATREIIDACDLKLDFGLNPATGKYRTWSAIDTTYAAEIRVSFDKTGYFSLVGIDSINQHIADSASSVGGGPGQCSLNLGGFTSQRPANWEGVVRHEFLHALSFHHSHQNMLGPCEAEFRWQDDAGYEPTQDKVDRFITDAAGKRPGIYTYLSGYPNFWGKAQIDHNLRTKPNPSVVTGPFDRYSVMLYRFPDFFYRSSPSACAPEGTGISLSEGDKRGLQLLYPKDDPVQASTLSDRRETLLAAMTSSLSSESSGLEGDTELSRAVRSTVQLLHAMK